MKSKYRSMALPGQLQLLFDQAQQVVHPAPQPTYVALAGAIPLAPDPIPQQSLVRLGLNAHDFKLAVREGSAFTFWKHVFLKVLNWALYSGLAASAVAKIYAWGAAF